MLRDTLGEKFNEFIEGYYRRHPWALPNVASSWLPLLDQERLVRIARLLPNTEILVVKDGRLLEKAAPHDSHSLSLFKAAGESLVLRKTERFDSGLGKIAADIAEELEAAVSVQVYWTPAAHFGFDWHYDAEEVFVAQIEGRKDYFLRENTVNPRPSFVPADLGFERERSPVIAATLLPGDWLYIPAGWWHMAVAREDALSISVGAFPKYSA